MTLTKHLIVEYLKRHGHHTTLKAFEKEAGVDTTGATLHYEKLEDIVADRTAYLNHSDVIKESVIHQVENAHRFKPWNDEVPHVHTDLDDSSALVVYMSTASGVVVGGVSRDVCVLCTADKVVTVLDLETKETVGVYTGFTSVVKCCYGIEGSDTLLSCGMDGKAKLIQLKDRRTFDVLGECQLHPRLVTDFKILKVGQDEHLIFSIGWNLTLRAHRLQDTKFTYLSQFKLLSNATAIAVAIFETTPIVLLTRLDSSQLAYFALRNNTLYEVTRVSLNDAEFSTHAFTGMCISTTSHELTKETQIVVGTSHIPYLRVIITRPPDLSTLLTNLGTATCVAEQQLSTPTLRGYILGNFNTMSPQDKFSQPRVVWRPDGSGVWIAGDDGVVRGVEFKSGVVVEELVGHDEKQRIKNMCVARVGREEILISAGVDKRVIYWG